MTGLDECGGKEEELPALDGFKYRYYFAGATSNLYALPTHPKPDSATDFHFNCYKGCTWEKLPAGSCSGASGVASGYQAAATDGYITPFASYGSSTQTNFKGETYQSTFIKSGKCVIGSDNPGSAPSSSPGSAPGTSAPSSSALQGAPHDPFLAMFTAMLALAAMVAL